MIQLLKRMRRREALMALLCAVLVVGQVFANAQTGNIVLLSAALLRAAAGELRADVRARRARELSFLSKKSRNVHKTFLDFSFFLLII